MTDTLLPIFHTVDAPITISEGRMRDLLCTAIEGGMSEQWACNMHHELADGLVIGDFTKGGKEALKVEEYFPSHQLIPFVEGCTLLIEDTEEEDEAGKPVVYRLDRAAMQRGLDLMATQMPTHFSDFIDENDDAITADVWFQLSCMGEVVYG
jgi:hypothetical protein